MLQIVCFAFANQSASFHSGVVTRYCGNHCKEMSAHFDADCLCQTLTNRAESYKVGAFQCIQKEPSGQPNLDSTIINYSSRVALWAIIQSLQLQSHKLRSQRVLQDWPPIKLRFVILSPRVLVNVIRVLYPEPCLRESVVSDRSTYNDTNYIFCSVEDILSLVCLTFCYMFQYMTSSPSHFEYNVENKHLSLPTTDSP